MESIPNRTATVRDNPSACRPEPDLPIKRLFTVDETAYQLSLSPRMVNILIKRKDLPSVTVGRARRVRIEDLDTYINSLTDSLA